MDDLLSCPFCGGNPEFNQGPRGEVFGLARSSVECSDCDISMCSVDAESEPDACIAHWNTRHTPEGYKLVPVELDNAALEAGTNALEHCCDIYGKADPDMVQDAWGEILDMLQALEGE